MNKNNLFYFDIETVGQHNNIKSFKKNDKRGYDLFMKKYNKIWFKDELGHEETYLNYSPISSTYGKIICLSFGYFHDKSDKGYTINTISNDNEFQLMKEIQNLFMKVSKKHLILSGFNINGFDIPWIVHKLNKYNLIIPPVLRRYGKKPWEIQTFDIFNEWKLTYSTYKFIPSFDEVCYELDIPSPKENIDGSQVHFTYWEENDLETIVKYCEGDVYSSLLVGEKMLIENI